MRVQGSRSRLLSLIPAVAAGCALLFGSSAAHAQAGARLSGRLEGGGTLLVSSPQSDRYGFGYTGRLDFGVRVGGPVHLHAFGQFLNWPASDAQAGAGPGQALLLGGGIGVEPEIVSRVKLRAEVDLGVSVNGASSDARFTWGAGVGAWFGIASVVDLGPIVRVGSVLAAESERADPGSAYFLTFGLAVAFHGAAEAPAPVAPEEPELNRTIAAPRETPIAVQETIAVTAPSAPVVAPPAPVVVEQPVTPPAPLATVTETTPEPEEEGRHGRHGRRGRHGGGSRHGGSRHGGGSHHGGGGSHHGGSHRRHH